MCYDTQQICTLDVKKNSKLFKIFGFQWWIKSKLIIKCKVCTLILNNLLAAYIKLLWEIIQKLSSTFYVLDSPKQKRLLIL